MDNHRWSKLIPGILVLIAFSLTSCSLSPLGNTGGLTSRTTPDSTTGNITQRLRIKNQSSFDLNNLVVLFPDERVDLGDVSAGATTGYFKFPKGVYRYAAYNVTIDGKRYEQPVVDWVGETPMDGETFTYSVDVDPTKWETDNWVIRLLNVIKDK